MSNEEYRLLNFSLDNIIDNVKTNNLTDEQYDLLLHKFKLAVKYLEKQQ